MKKIILSFILALTSFGVFAQKFAYIDTDYILSNIPEYNDAQKKLDDISKVWQKEIEDKYKEIDAMYKKYQDEAVLLTQEMKKKREDEITAKEKEVKELQKQRFGYEGDLFKKRQELVKPIQDKVYDAVQKMAVAKAYDFIFDKSNGVMMIYANTKLDLSDQIIGALGYAPTKPKDPGTNGNGAGASPGATSPGGTPGSPAGTPTKDPLQPK